MIYKYITRNILWKIFEIYMKRLNYIDIILIQNVMTHKQDCSAKISSCSSMIGAIKLSAFIKNPSQT